MAFANEGGLRGEGGPRGEGVLRGEGGLRGEEVATSSLATSSVNDASVNDEEVATSSLAEALISSVRTRRRAAWHAPTGRDEFSTRLLRAMEAIRTPLVFYMQAGQG